MQTTLLDLRTFHSLRDKTVAQLTEATRDAIHAAVKEGASWAARHHIHKKKTGNLTSLRHLYGRTTKRDSRGTEGEIVNTAPYVRHVEYKTKAHWIRPKAGYGTMGPLPAGQSRRSKTDIGTHRIALRWYVNGKPIFRAAVYHPGTTAKPFMFPAGAHAERVAIASLEDRFSRIGRLWL